MSSALRSQKKHTFLSGVSPSSNSIILILTEDFKRVYNLEGGTLVQRLASNVILQRVHTSMDALKLNFAPACSCDQL